ncbi:hypothetical protein GDO81_024261 [Engystomops pustulosus]|uniref:Uncharacterized protein n=1 Tax=Engystomops pustulosus TaxID=76066 RepID=A0AAV6ZKG7_ENGPU|nr:hypothetical protein GDO81_024261 [Engystomops pustulosus]
MMPNSSVQCIHWAQANSTELLRLMVENHSKIKFIGRFCIQKSPLPKDSAVQYFVHLCNDCTRCCQPVQWKLLSGCFSQPIGKGV